MFIGGEKVQAGDGKTLDVINPATDEVFATVPAGSSADVEAAVQAAKQAHESAAWRGMSAAQRSAVLLKAADIIEARADEFIRVETLDTGKPIIESRAFDIPMAVDHLRYYGNLVVDILGETIPTMPEILDYTVREPIGVIGEITPWNFPCVLACRKLGPSLAAGNTVVLKPATWAPLTTLMLADVFMEAGLPAGTLNIVSGTGGAVGEALTRHPAVHKVSFTGSTEVGCIVMRGAAEDLKCVSLEMGGKSPAVVFADADIDAAVEGIMFGAFLNQGECCCAATRICIDESIHDEFVKRFVARTAQIVVGDPLDEATKMGAIIHPEHWQKVSQYIQKGIDEGATLLLGGPDKPAGLERGNFIPCTVFSDVTPEMTIYREEIFGPVITITPFQGYDALIEAANDTEYGLAASVWTTGLSNAHNAAAQIVAGTLWVNVHNFVFSQAPYGGYKQSGLGRELGREGLYAYTETKNVVAWIGNKPFTWY
jgi:aldehyde dehydrogenase (NAD+)